MKKKRYFWQPELSISIIYWSLTFIILFYGLILTLEKTHPYLQGNIFIGIFVVFLIMGFHRYLTLDKSGVKVRYMRIWRLETISHEHIDYLIVCKDGIVLQRKGLSGATFHFAMKKKTKNTFVETFVDYFPEIEVKEINEKISRN